MKPDERRKRDRPSPAGPIRVIVSDDPLHLAFAKLSPAKMAGIIDGLLAVRSGPKKATKTKDAGTQAGRRRSRRGG
jgi:hypothetical protein